MYETAFHCQHSLVLKQLTIPNIDWDSSPCSLEDRNTDYTGLFLFITFTFVMGLLGIQCLFMCLNSLRRHFSCQMANIYIATNNFL